LAALALWVPEESGLFRRFTAPEWASDVTPFVSV
jgi:hypothetical protein